MELSDEEVAKVKQYVAEHFANSSENFVELLIDGMANYGNEIRLEEDNFKDYRKANFDELYEMYGGSIEMEHSCCCICRIPEDWLPK